MTQNQVNEVSTAGQGAEGEIEMTQNQVYRADEENITPQANVVYGVGAGGTQSNLQPLEDDGYEYMVWLHY